MKKLTALSLAVLLVFAALALTAYAEESKKTFTIPRVTDGVIRVDNGEVLLMPCAFEKISPFPSEEEIKEQLENRALETVADRRLRELRRASITEIRK